MPPPEPEGLGLGELALACAQQTSVWARQQLGAELDPDAFLVGGWQPSTRRPGAALPE